MSKYSLDVFVLENCHYSNAALELIDNYNLKNKNIIKISYEDKEKYKTDLINTFPQIYLKKNNTKGTLLLGGYNDLKELYDKFYNKYNTNTNTKYINDHPNISEKSLLRVIELINSK